MKMCPLHYFDAHLREASDVNLNQNLALTITFTFRPD